MWGRSIHLHVKVSPFLFVARFYPIGNLFTSAFERDPGASPTIFAVFPIKSQRSAYAYSDSGLPLEPDSSCTEGRSSFPARHWRPEHTRGRWERTGTAVWSPAFGWAVGGLLTVRLRSLLGKEQENQKAGTPLAAFRCATNLPQGEKDGGRQVRVSAGYSGLTMWQKMVQKNRFFTITCI